MNKDQIALIGKCGIAASVAGESLSAMAKAGLSMQEIAKTLRDYRRRNSNNRCRVGNYKKALKENRVFKHKSKYHG